MRAAVITPRQKDSLRVIDVPDPRPAEGEVLVDMLEAGICGTDDELVAGLVGEAPEGSDYLIIGHENLGRVRETGKGVECNRGGDLVVATVRRPCPRRCFECRNYHQDMCLTGDYFERGIKGMHGYMAEQYVERTEHLVTIPPRLEKVAVLLEPLSIVEKGIGDAFRMQERLPWKPGRALVAGAGPIGLLAAFVLRDMGIETWAFATREVTSPKARAAEASGARYVNARETPMEQIVSDHGPFDLIVEATGSSEIAFKAMRLVNKNGIVCLTGLSPHRQTHSVCTDCVNMDLVMNNKAVFGTVSANRMHYEWALDRMASIEKKWPGLLGRMFTRRVSLDRVGDGLRREKDDIKVVVDVV
ncbi:MAG: Glucose 1-dehydrogenase [Methanocella sp. PtaU1.Bin125]|nr:MAG: Glucose 1-dehydrogenase [Methanocella sp. PtaU1.Bin125]